MKRRRRLPDVRGEPQDRVSERWTQAGVTVDILRISHTEHPDVLHKTDDYALKCMAVFVE